MSLGLSVCLIVKNEEQMLPGCIESVRDLADEIVIVDTGSIDRSIEIAEEAGCRVFRSSWKDDFSLARNESLSHARYPFILVIDADERLHNPQALIQTLANTDPATGGWLVNIESKARRADGKDDIYVSSLLRLFRNHQHIRYQGIIHEQIHDSIIALGLKIQNTPVQLIHHGYSYSPENMSKKNSRNLNLLDIAIKNNRGDGYNIFQRAKTYLAMGDQKHAEEDIQAALKLLKPTGAARPQALNFGAVIATQLGNLQLANERAMESLTIIPNQSFANYILGENYYQLKDYSTALDYYRKMAAAQKMADEKARIVGDYNLPEDDLCFRIGRCLIALNRTDEAAEAFTEGLHINPKSSSCMVGLANAYFMKGNHEKAKELLRNAINLEPGRQDLRKFLEQVESAAKFRNIVSTTKIEPATGDVPKSGQPLITLSMIVKNEEKTLPTCIESVKDVVDEIVIVDTGSSDRTVEIAQKYGAKVYHYTWNNDFAEARNEALKHSTGEWILYLDADETLTPESTSIIRNLLLNAPTVMGAYVCSIESAHSQLDGSTEMHRGGYPRIFRNYGYPTIQFQGRVHEQITPSIFALGKAVDLSDLVIIHTGYDRSREEMDAKVRRNYAMLIQHVNEEPLNAYAWYQLGQTLTQMSLFNEAEQAIRFSLNLGTLSGSVYASATATLAQIVGNQKKFAEALLWSEKSLEKAPTQVYALHLKAYSLMYLDRLDEAEEAFNEVLSRVHAKKGVPKSGFDIDIPESLVITGMNELKRKRMEKAQ